MLPKIDQLEADARQGTGGISGEDEDAVKDADRQTDRLREREREGGRGWSTAAERNLVLRNNLDMCGSPTNIGVTIDGDTSGS